MSKKQLRSSCMCRYRFCFSARILHLFNFILKFYSLISIFFSPLIYSTIFVFVFFFLFETDAIDDGFDIQTKVSAASTQTQTVDAIESESIVLSCGRTKMTDDDVKWFFNGNSVFFFFVSLNDTGILRFILAFHPNIYTFDMPD